MRPGSTRTRRKLVRHVRHELQLSGLGGRSGHAKDVLARGPRGACPDGRTGRAPSSRRASSRMPSISSTCRRVFRSCHLDQVAFGILKPGCAAQELERSHDPGNGSPEVVDHRPRQLVAGLRERSLAEAEADGFGERLGEGGTRRVGRPSGRALEDRDAEGPVRGAGEEWRAGSTVTVSGRATRRRGSAGPSRAAWSRPRSARPRIPSSVRGRRSDRPSVRPVDLEAAVFTRYREVDAGPGGPVRDRFRGERHDLPRVVPAG